MERPSFAKYIVPSTWSSDGIGFFGSLAPTLKYETYVVGGLDGSAFTAKNGIRSGRIKERQSLSDPAITGRLDFYPLAQRTIGYGQRLRLGLSAYLGGVDNCNQDKNPGIDGDIVIYSGDRYEWTLGLTFYPIPSLVIKADYQIREDGTDKDLDDLFNLGIGWQF